MPHNLHCSWVSTPWVFAPVLFHLLSASTFKNTDFILYFHLAPTSPSVVAIVLVFVTVFSLAQAGLLSGSDSVLTSTQRLFVKEDELIINTATPALSHVWHKCVKQRFSFRKVIIRCKIGVDCSRNSGIHHYGRQDDNLRDFLLRCEAISQR